MTEIHHLFCALDDFLLFVCLRNTSLFLLHPYKSSECLWLPSSAPNLQVQFDPLSSFTISAQGSTVSDNICVLLRLSGPTPVLSVGANGSFMAFVSRGFALHALSFSLPHDLLPLKCFDYTCVPTCSGVLLARNIKHLLNPRTAFPCLTSRPGPFRYPRGVTRDAQATAEFIKRRLFSLGEFHCL